MTLDLFLILGKKQVYSYRFLDLEGTSFGGPARVSVWPTWNSNGDTVKTTKAPLSDLDEGALDFNLWKDIGEEFLTTSSSMTCPIA